jgi:hypothetical protein
MQYKVEGYYMKSGGHKQSFEREVITSSPSAAENKAALQVLMSFEDHQNYTVKVTRVWSLVTHNCDMPVDAIHYEPDPHLAIQEMLEFDERVIDTQVKDNWVAAFYLDGSVKIFTVDTYPPTGPMTLSESLEAIEDLTKQVEGFIDEQSLV